MYRTVDAAFWTDPKVRKLTPPAKFFFLYLITNQHSHVSGIYVLPLKYASTDLGYPIATVSALLDTLSDVGILMFDATTEVVWVRNMMAYQGRGEKNLRSAANHITNDLHASYICVEFLKAYPAVVPFIEQKSRAYPIDRVSIGSPTQDGVATPYQEQEQEQEQKKTPVVPKASRKLAADVSGFVEFWDRYPKKVGKADALTAWRKLQPMNGALEHILAALTWQVQLEQWTKDGGQYIPSPAKYLNKRRWEDQQAITMPLLSTRTEFDLTEEEKRALREKAHERMFGGKST